jgi:16S rRNA processing protein RimM
LIGIAVVYGEGSRFILHDAFPNCFLMIDFILYVVFSSLRQWGKAILKHFLEAGQIVSTQGLSGEVRVMPWCDSPEFLAQFDGFYFGEGTDYRKVISSRINKNLFIVKFDGINDIDGAMKLLKNVIYIDREWVKLPEGAYFEQDLIGLSVEDADSGHIYGVIGEVARTGANDIYRVDDGKSQVWIPAIGDIVKSVDVAGGKMLITPIKGLFDDAD